MNSHGCYSDTLTKAITAYPYPVANAGPDRVVLEGGLITIQSASTGASLQYLWTPALYLNDRYIANPKCVDPKNDITYTLMVTSPGGCTVTDQMFVKVLKIPRIPNTFTPNNDGVNDLWTIQYLEDYPHNHIQVFTRAGQLVYEHRGFYHAWDGKYKGKELPFDTYYYILEPGSSREPMTGYVTIIK
jgi:gliding motility-associated-like protein